MTNEQRRILMLGAMVVTVRTVGACASFEGGCADARRCDTPDAAGFAASSDSEISVPAAVDSGAPEPCGTNAVVCAGHLGCISGECAQVVSMLAGSSSATCALLTALGGDAGRLKCWGGNFGGLLGMDPARIGTEVAAPVVPPLTPFRDVSLSPYHACGIQRSADAVECWGSNAGAELGTMDVVEPGHSVVTSVPGVAQVATSAYATCVRTHGGQVLCWGAGVAGGTAATRAEPASMGIEGATSLLSGGWGFCATLADETARCWGPYLTPAPAPLEDGRVHGLVSMGLGGSVPADLHFCYVHSEGLTCLGRNDNGQLGAGDFEEHAQRVAVSLPSRPVRVATGLRHTCAATESGDLYCWGANDLGQLGLGPDVGKVAGSFRSVETPTKVPALEGVLDVTASNGTTCVRLRTGQVQCFGANESGNAGDATFLKRFTPVNVVGLP